MLIEQVKRRRKLCRSYSQLWGLKEGQIYSSHLLTGLHKIRTLKSLNTLHNYMIKKKLSTNLLNALLLWVIFPMSTSMSCDVEFSWEECTRLRHAGGGKTKRLRQATTSAHTLPNADSDNRVLYGQIPLKCPEYGRIIMQNTSNHHSFLNDIQIKHCIF